MPRASLRVTSGGEGPIVVYDVNSRLMERMTLGPSGSSIGSGSGSGSRPVGPVALAVKQCPGGPSCPGPGPDSQTLGVTAQPQLTSCQFCQSPDLPQLYTTWQSVGWAFWGKSALAKVPRSPLTRVTRPHFPLTSVHAFPIQCRIRDRLWLCWLSLLEFCKERSLLPSFASDRLVRLRLHSLGFLPRLVQNLLESIICHGGEMGIGHQDTGSRMAVQFNEPPGHLGSHMNFEPELPRLVLTRLIRVRVI